MSFIIVVSCMKAWFEWVTDFANSYNALEHNIEKFSIYGINWFPRDPFVPNTRLWKCFVYIESL